MRRNKPQKLHTPNDIWSGNALAGVCISMIKNILFNIKPHVVSKVLAISIHSYSTFNSFATLNNTLILAKKTRLFNLTERIERQTPNKKKTRLTRSGICSDKRGHFRAPLGILRTLLLRSHRRRRWLQPTRRIFPSVLLRCTPNRYINPFPGDRVVHASPLMNTAVLTRVRETLVELKAWHLFHNGRRAFAAHHRGRRGGRSIRNTTLEQITLGDARRVINVNAWLSFSVRRAFYQSWQKYGNHASNSYQAD